MATRGEIEGAWGFWPRASNAMGVSNIFLQHFRSPRFGAQGLEYRYAKEATLVTKSTILLLYAAILFVVAGFLYSMGRATLESFREWRTSRSMGHLWVSLGCALVILWVVIMVLRDVT